GSPAAAVVLPELHRNRIWKDHSR
ncbi:MAG: hypothetical protein QOE37_1222, partial [Microbacteriaceae bacterium]|nr:hypothetical protein [Microbacteriaceae bacterium]